MGGWINDLQLLQQQDGTAWRQWWKTGDEQNVIWSKTDCSGGWITASKVCGLKREERERSIGCVKRQFNRWNKTSDVSSNWEHISIRYATRVSPSLFQFSLNPSIITHNTLVRDYPAVYRNMGVKTKRFKDAWKTVHCEPKHTLIYIKKEEKYKENDL